MISGELAVNLLTIVILAFGSYWVGRTVQLRRAAAACRKWAADAGTGYSLRKCQSGGRDYLLVDAEYFRRLQVDAAQWRALKANQEAREADGGDCVAILKNITAALRKLNEADRP